MIDYARQYHEDPVEAVQTAITRGEKLVWLNSVSAMISDFCDSKGRHIGLEWDQVVMFDGKRYQIKPDHNNNINLVEVQ